MEIIMSKKMPVKQSGYATASFIIGLFDLVELVLCFANLSTVGVYIGVGIAVVSVVLGIIGLREIKKYKMNGKTLAIFGIVFGAIGILALPFNLFIWEPTVNRILQEIAAKRLSK
jgi:hypothetical protein